MNSLNDIKEQLPNAQVKTFRLIKLFNTEKNLTIYDGFSQETYGDDNTILNSFGNKNDSNNFKETLSKHYQQIIESIYRKVNFEADSINSFLFFQRELKNVIIAKIVCIFPNVNLVFRNINKISVSQNDLSSAMMGKKEDLINEDIKINNLDCGYIYKGIHKKERIELNFDVLKERTAIGIWIYLIEEVN
jgi:hypothetical protein